MVWGGGRAALRCRRAIVDVMSRNLAGRLRGRIEETIQDRSCAIVAFRPEQSAQVAPLLVGPPVALTLHVLARILAEVGRTEDEDLEALRPALVASPRAGWDANHVPLLDLDDLVVELHPPAPAHDHVELLLFLVRVAV